jgi:hypothetical protein
MASTRKDLRIKGILLQVFQDHLRTLVDQAVIEPNQREPLPILREEVVIAGWYPLRELVGWCDQVALLIGSDEEGLREFGRGVASEAERRGHYQQFKVTAEKQGFDLAIRLVVTLAELLHEYMEWKFLEASLEGGFVLQATNASGWSEELRQITTGWIDHMARNLYGCPMRVESERPEPDRILFVGRPLRASIG